MTVTGTILQVMPETSGLSKTGSSWRKREYLLETKDRFPKKICFSVMNAKIEELNIMPGATYMVDLDIESREYNGRWYHSITAFRASLTTT